MYEIDFLPVENEGSSKSGDAIAVHFSASASQTAVVVIDGGFADTGGQLAEHIKKYYKTDHVDLMISTHPDADHLNGLATAMEGLRVNELLIHRPRQHVADVTEFSNIEVIDELLDLAKSHGVSVAEPFTGVERLGGQLRILGPTQPYYEQLVQEHLDDEKSGRSRARSSVGATLRAKAASWLDRAVSYLPVETLTDEGETSPRNNTSAITLIQVDGVQLLFTGDAGMPALTYAAEEYEARVGSFSVAPLRSFQAPHHGSKRNLGPTILNRMLGRPSQPFANLTAVISSAKADPKHPSPKVVNALSRRGAAVCATEGKSICYSSDAPDRPGWTPIEPLPPLPEDDDDD